MITATGALAHDRFSLQARALSLVLASGLLAASSWVSVPMPPVPMTMQTLAVTLVGAALGPRLGAAAVLLWLGQAAAGLPVLAGGTGGLAPFVGPTAGYLLAFPIAAACVGALVQAGWDARRPLAAFAAMVIGNGLCLAIGGAWLAALIGAEAAWASGVAPFILGGALKAALGAALLCGAGRAAPRAA
jgi:biotin transport system substrate-specific component